MWGSTVPVVLPLLVSSLRGAPGMENVKVLDGPALDGSTASAWVLVGIGEDGSAAEGENSTEGLSAARSREQYSVECTLRVSSGSTKVATSRERAYEVFGAVGAFLASDPTLGRSVMKASIGRWVFSQKQDGKGFAAEIAFTVDIDTYTRP